MRSLTNVIVIWGRQASVALLLSLGGLAFAAPTCARLADGSAIYLRATSVVRQIAEFRVWSKSHSFPVAFLAPVDKEVWINGKCYWSVTVSADRPERFELWHVFYIHLPSKTILVEDSVAGDPILLRDWRKLATLVSKKSSQNRVP
jgi:hypothetical protein